MLTVMISLLLSQVHAADYVLPSNPNEVVDTPLGPVRADVIVSLCLAERVYIADITDTESYKVTYAGRLRVLTDVQLTILHALKGSYPSPIYVEQIPGGRVGDVVMRTTHAALNPVIGKRYVVSQQSFLNPESNQSRWAITSALELDPLVRIPEDAATQFMQYVQQYCP